MRRLKSRVLALEEQMKELREDTNVRVFLGPTDMSSWFTMKEVVMKMLGHLGLRLTIVPGRGESIELEQTKKEDEDGRG